MVEKRPELNGADAAAHWHDVLVARCRGDRALEGRRLDEIARDRDRDPIDVCFDLLLEENGNVGCVFFTMCEDDVQTVMCWPHTMVGSDASSDAPYGTLGEGKPHPRAYGTFPRVLGRYVRERAVLSWEEAVRKMASLPAARLGLRGRGELRAGAFADVVVLDPATVADHATFERPHQYAAGIEHVVVNGVRVVAGGEHTGALPGRVLRHTSSEFLVPSWPLPYRVTLAQLGTRNSELGTRNSELGMRILITGSSGQIGTNLGLRLAREGHAPLGIDNRLNPWTDAIPTRLLDLAQPQSVGRGRLGGVEIGRVDAVVHLAAHAKVHALVERPLGALENHVMVTNALEFARISGCAIILASSREVYGNTVSRDVPVPEGAADFRNAPSPYAAMKLASEALGAAYSRCYDMPHAVIRFSNVYGRYDNDLERLERAIWLFRRNILAGRPVPVFGREKLLDFTYVDDAVDGLARCLERLVVGDQAVTGQTFNLAYGEGHRLVDVVQLIAGALGRSAEICVLDARPGEVMWYVADISKARRLLAYSPLVPVPEGIRRAMDWAGRRQ